jgi:hypothetical protein
MNQAFLAVMDAITEGSLVILTFLLRAEYKAYRVTLADSLASDLPFFALLFIV